MRIRTPEYKAWQKRWFKRNKKHLADYAAKRYREKKEYICKQAKDYRNRLRAEVFSHYGGEVCACCGITEPSFLTLGHINGDGAAHRKKIGLEKMGGYNFYRWLKRNGYPPLPLRVECFNCNCGKHYRNGGKCIHESP
jgi:hypothetical protein